MFLLSTWVRLRPVRHHRPPGAEYVNRWPHLLGLVKQYIHIFLTWGTVLPLLLLFLIFALNFLASKWLWPQADDFTLEQLVPLYFIWPFVLVWVPP